MKKDMFKFLSIVLSAAMLSPMLSINSAEALNPSEGAADSTSTTDSTSKISFLDEAKWTKGEASEIYSEFCGYCTPVSSILDDGKLSTKKCIEAAIFKLNNFLKEHSCSTLQELNSEIIDRIVDFRVRTGVRDLKLRFFDSLMDVLIEITYEGKFSSSENVNNQLRCFCCYMKSMVCLINATLIRSNITEEFRNTCLDGVKSIIGTPLDTNLKENEALDSWEESGTIEYDELDKFEKELIERFEEESKKESLVK